MRNYAIILSILVLMLLPFTVYSDAQAVDLHEEEFEKVVLTLEVQEDGKVYIEHAFKLHGDHEQLIYNVHAQVQPIDVQAYVTEQYESFADDEAPRIQGEEASEGFVFDLSDHQGTFVVESVWDDVLYYTEDAPEESLATIPMMNPSVLDIVHHLTEDFEIIFQTENGKPLNIFEDHYYEYFDLLRFIERDSIRYTTDYYRFSSIGYLPLKVGVPFDVVPEADQFVDDWIYVNEESVVRVQSGMLEFILTIVTYGSIVVSLLLSVYVIVVRMWRYIARVGRRYKKLDRRFKGDVDPFFYLFRSMGAPNRKELIETFLASLVYQNKATYYSNGEGQFVEIKDLNQIDKEEMRIVKRLFKSKKNEHGSTTEVRSAELKEVHDVELHQEQLDQLYRYGWSKVENYERVSFLIAGLLWFYPFFTLGFAVLSYLEDHQFNWTTILLFGYAIVTTWYIFKYGSDSSVYISYFIFTVIYIMSYVDALYYPLFGLFIGFVFLFWPSSIIRKPKKSSRT
ncbi:hypothetical protein [Geomicrobium sediminis]|uniref:DUF2207 domain-containing protein n=1 Tax=Geomicrobium sediminis TaxID=1347788 RepID=A0ABS2PI37_9BACL|nr:hypothetical protein [Geomicrobium sediminis]MBM7635104.1 hypothetical protein [Geomicrobium sediminis]